MPGLEVAKTRFNPQTGLSISAERRAAIQRLNLPALLVPPKYYHVSRYKEPALSIMRARESYELKHDQRVRVYSWRELIDYLHYDQVPTDLPDLISELYTGITDTFSHDEDYFLSVGGELRRLEVPERMTHDESLPLYFWTVANYLLALPVEGDPQNFYEQLALSTLERLRQSFNADLKIPDRLVQPESIYDQLRLRTRIFAETHKYSLTEAPETDSSVEYHIKEWWKLWHPRQTDGIVYGRNESWVHNHDFMIQFRPSTKTKEYVLRIEKAHQTKGNKNWTTLHIIGGIVDEAGRYQDINLELYISPLSTLANGLAFLDQRSGELVNARQQQGVKFFKNGRASLPENQAREYLDYEDHADSLLVALPTLRRISEPEDLYGRLWSVLIRMLRYQSLLYPGYVGTKIEGFPDSMPRTIKSLFDLVNEIKIENMVYKNKTDEDIKLDPGKLQEIIQEIFLMQLRTEAMFHNTAKRSGLYDLFAHARPFGQTIDAPLLADQWLMLDTDVPVHHVIDHTLVWHRTKSGIEYKLERAKEAGIQLPHDLSLAAQFLWLFDPQATSGF